MHHSVVKPAITPESSYNLGTTIKNFLKLNVALRIVNYTFRIINKQPYVYPEYKDVYYLVIVFLPC